MAGFILLNPNLGPSGRCGNRGRRQSSYTTAPEIWRCGMLFYVARRLRRLRHSGADSI